MEVNCINISFSEEQGSSLIAVLVIITILSFLIGTVLIGTIIQKRFIQRDVDRIQARYSAEAGIFHFLADSTLPALPEADSLSVQLMDSTKEAIIEIEPFGGFLAVTSTAKSSKQSKMIQTLVGEQGGPVFQHAIVLGDMYSALNLTGQTTIEGDILTGPLGVKKESFKGELFKGTVNGAITQQEEAVLPEFDKTLFNHEIAYCDTLLNKKPSGAIQIDSGRVDLSAYNRIKPDEIYYTEGNLELTASSEVELPEGITIITGGNMTLGGSIIYAPFSRFIAGKTLNVQGNLTGQHGLFYTNRELFIDNDKSLSGQFIAKENMTITGSTYLEYPSVAYLKGKTKGGIREGRLELSETAKVDGTMLIPAPDSVLTDDKIRLVVGEKAQVRGGIYNTGQTEVHGQVQGSILTLQFYFYQSPTAYVNWLKDVVIDVEKRPKNYVTPLGFSSKRRFQVLEWREM